MDTVKQALAGIAGSMLLAGCLTDPAIVYVPDTAEVETEDATEDDSGDDTTLRPFESHPDALVPVLPAWSPAAPAEACRLALAGPPRHDSSVAVDGLDGALRCCWTSAPTRARWSAPRC